MSNVLHPVGSFDPNGGGGPKSKPKHVAPNQRGGFGQHGQRRTFGSSKGTPRPTAPNPATRGGTPHSFHPDQNASGHGGSVAMRAAPVGATRGGGFGTDGKAGTVNGYRNANPKPGAGNTKGKMHRRVVGHFDHASKGSSSGAMAGAYGAPPVTADV